MELPEEQVRQTACAVAVAQWMMPLGAFDKARSMTVNEDALRDLCERLCQDVSVDRRPDGALMLRTQFRFPDGDGLPIHLSEAPSGGLRLSDRGHTLMRISYDHDVDAFMDGADGALLERIVAESGVQREGGAFCLDTPANRLPEALHRLGQALTRIYDLACGHERPVGASL